MLEKKTAIVAGAEQGIGAGLAEGFLTEVHNVVATLPRTTRSFSYLPHWDLGDRESANQGTSVKTADGVTQHVETINVLVTDVEIFRTKPFDEFTTEEFNAPVLFDLTGFLHMRQAVVDPVLKGKSRNGVTVTGALANNPIAGVDTLVPMSMKDGLDTIIRQPAIEYAQERIGFNGVAPGVEDAPLRKDDRKMLPEDTLANKKNGQRLRGDTPCHRF
jgi:NAD(P)-dependent dehydrogenase (short-subunit alcohol dehydrogenase family)